MKISSLFTGERTVYSLEIFPPKKNGGSMDTIYKTLDGLKDIKPDFISVTYGAGGNPSDSSTIDICSIIKDKYNITPVAHLTCVNNTRQDIDAILKTLSEHGIENILALRGDNKPDIAPQTDFKYANELITYIKRSYDFGISAACYPEGHVENDSLIDDVKRLKYKVDCGAEHLVSQLFFDNESFFRFIERARIAGITVPIEAGIMPVINKSQIERMIMLSGASFPPKLARIICKFGDNPEAMRDAGIAYAVDQIIDLVSAGVDGIHLYTMNRPDVAAKIFDSVGATR